MDKISMRQAVELVKNSHKSQRALNAVAEVLEHIASLDEETLRAERTKKAAITAMEQAVKDKKAAEDALMQSLEDKTTVEKAAKRTLNEAAEWSSSTRKLATRESNSTISKAKRRADKINEEADAFNNAHAQTMVKLGKEKETLSIEINTLTYELGKLKERLG